MPLERESWPLALKEAQSPSPEAIAPHPKGWGMSGTCWAGAKGAGAEEVGAEEQNGGGGNASDAGA